MKQQINLFNKDFLKQKKIFTSAAMAQSLLLLLVATLGLAWYGNYNTARLEEQAELGAALLAKKKVQQEQVMRDFAPKKSDPAIERMLNSAVAEQAIVRQLIGALDGDNLGNTLGYSAVFAALARQSMDQLWLTGLTIDGAANHIDLQGKAMEAELIPTYISRLQKEAVLRGKEFGGLKLTRPSAMVTSGKDGQPAVGLAPYVEFHLQATSGAAELAPQRAEAPAPAPVSTLENDNARASK